MYNHEPQDYACPFCLLLRGIRNQHVISTSADIFYQDEDVSAFISSHQWPRNQGHALVIPNQHYENIFDLPPEMGSKIHLVARKIALAMKTLYECDGISTRQHNEPAGNQDVWHYHLHVFPRYTGDNLYTSQFAEMPEEKRAGYANQLMKYFERLTDEP